MKPLKDSNDPSTNGHGSARKPDLPTSPTPSTGLIPDTGQVGNVIRPPAVGPDSPRRLNVAPDSLMAVLAGMVSVATMTQLVEYQAISNAFMAETIERLNFAANGVDGYYRHATFTETAERFLAAEEAKGNSAHTPADSESVTEGPVLPIFPRFRLESTFSGWVRSLAETEDIAEFTAVLGTTSDLTFSKITTAMMLGHGLRRFAARVFAGEFTIDHVHAVTRAARDLAFEHFPALDDYLAHRRADVTIETFRKSVNTKVAILEPVEDRLEEASKRRRVSITTYPDGTAAVTLSGPAVELKAYILRLEAFARAIKAGQISEFTTGETTGINAADERSIDALMFDISTRTRPQLTIQVTTHDTTTGGTTTNEVPLDIPEDKATTAVGIVATANHEAEIARAAAATVAAAAAGEAEASASDADADASGIEVTTSLNLVLPTQGQWMAGQGKMLVTVPFLTLAGESELPGVFSDGAPVPADAVRAIAGQCPTWTRILTDPATGTPIDAKATTYAIPAAVRRTLVAKWQSCTTPGCTRRAESSEIDHLIPYDHENPGTGGLTTFMNTHPVCKAHHQAKTDRKYRVRKTGDGCVEYVFRHGVTTDVAPADQPINVEHARQFDHWTHPPDPGGGPPDPGGDPSDPGGGPPAPGDELPDPLFDASVRPPRPAEPEPRPPAQRDRRCLPSRQLEGTQGRTKKRRGRRAVKGSANSMDPWSADARSIDSYWDRSDPPPF